MPSLYASWITPWYPPLCHRQRNEKRSIFLNISDILDFFDWAKVEVTDILAAKYEKATYIVVMTGG
jgi:hypothetical protein